MTEEEKREAARLLGKLGGSKGGKTRAKNMPPKREPKPLVRRL